MATISTKFVLRCRQTVWESVGKMIVLSVQSIFDTISYTKCKSVSMLMSEPKKSSNLKYSLFGCCFAKKITIVELLTPKNDDENWSNDTFEHFDLNHCKLHGSKSFWVGHLHGKMHTLCCFSQNRKAEQLLFLLWIVEPPKGEHEIQISRWFLNLPTCGFESVYCSEMTNWPPDYRHILLHYKHFGPTATIHMFQRWIKKNQRRV